MFDRDRIADYQRMVAALRAAGIRAELYLGNPKDNIGTQMKYADKRGAPCAVIQGGDEKAQGRGADQGPRSSAPSSPEPRKDRDEYLQKQAEAQFAVPEAELVEAVRKAARAPRISPGAVKSLNAPGDLAHRRPRGIQTSLTTPNIWPPAPR